MKENALNMNSDVFESLINDFNGVLKKTLGNMRSKQSEVAEITLKLKITLKEEEVADAYSESGRRDVVKPTFAHKVGSVMQIKEETSGTAKGNYEIVYDDETKEYIIRPIDDGQVTFEDTCYTCDPVEVECEPCDSDEDGGYALPELKPREVMYIESGECTEDDNDDALYEGAGFPNLEEDIFSDD